MTVEITSATLNPDNTVPIEGIDTSEAHLHYLERTSDPGYARNIVFTFDLNNR